MGFSAEKIASTVLAYGRSRILRHDAVAIGTLHDGTYKFATSFSSGKVLFWKISS